MAQLEGANVEKLQGGLLRLATNTDNHVGWIISGIPAGDVATAVNNGGKGVRLRSAYDAEQIGVTVSFDANNGLKVHDQIVEFFRLAPNATLYIFNSSVPADLTGFITINKEIKGYALNVIYDSDEPNLTSTVAAHQNIVNDYAAVNRFIDFAVIGFDELNVFPDLRALSAPNVSVVIACEKPDKKVSVGAFLGMLAVRKINENAGSVNIENKPLAKRGTENYPLDDANLNRWTGAYLSDGTSVDALATAALDGIIESGYIVAAGYQEYSGYYFSDSGTCIDLASDFAFIENNRTWNKAARLIRATLLPLVKGRVKKNPTTGFIAPTTAQNWTNLVQKQLNKMVADDELSGFDVYINPNQVVNNTSPVIVKARLVVDGIVHEFNIQLGLTNNL